MSDYVTAYAPASIGNVAVGFDMLGIALSGAGDRVQARKINNNSIIVKEVIDPNGNLHPHLSTKADENTASIAAKSLWDSQGEGGGIELRVLKGLPLQSGMGSSAASAVAATVAVNSLLSKPLPLGKLLPFALEGEKYASGGMHADNVAPSLFGGLVLCPDILLPEVFCLPSPSDISVVLVNPDLQVNTASARRILPKTVSMELWLEQQGLMSGFIHACYSSDVNLLGRTLRDVIIEPHRKKAIPCFDDIVSAAIKTGALGCTLSGSGPSMFALCKDDDAKDVANAMQQEFSKIGISSNLWISAMNAPGAFIEA
ncbi:MAG: homoserine kinase [Gammaproteobacteria bacterium]|nr:homoserine kinase [Gammaproteobacteria bacterium]|tara:strand:- start:460 stop:1401 length:942 start_codon:yes stop_codon:yes gene_type:complete